jgi:hypothetical protein
MFVHNIIWAATFSNFLEVPRKSDDIKRRLNVVIFFQKSEAGLVVASLKYQPSHTLGLL